MWKLYYNAWISFYRWDRQDRQDSNDQGSATPAIVAIWKIIWEPHLSILMIPATEKCEKLQAPAVSGIFFEPKSSFFSSPFSEVHFSFSFQPYEVEKNQIACLELQSVVRGRHLKNIPPKYILHSMFPRFTLSHPAIIWEPYSIAPIAGIASTKTGRSWRSQQVYENQASVYVLKVFILCKHILFEITTFNG